MANAEGPVSLLCTDANKYQCTNCNGSKFYVSKLIDDPNDCVGDTVFAAYDITITGGIFMGLVGLCAQCGVEQILWWIFEDTAAATGASLVMVNLDAGTANTMADLYMIALTGTLYAATKYSVIASHTAADPTTITIDVASDNTEDGPWLITNRLPTGYTLDT